jgi:hypothetical protein
MSFIRARMSRWRIAARMSDHGSMLLAMRLNIAPFVRHLAHRGVTEQSNNSAGRPASIPDYLARWWATRRTVIPACPSGREVGGCRARQFRAYRIDPGGLARVARGRCQCRIVGADAGERELALLFRTLATLRTDIALFEEMSKN